MQVKDLKPKLGNVDITVDVVDVGEAREFNKFGKVGKVATAIGKDETGDIKLSLWNEDVDKVKAGDKIKLTNGYVNEWQGEMQLTTGRMGKIEVVGKSEAGSDDSSKIKTNIPAEATDDNFSAEEDVEDVNDDEI